MTQLDAIRTALDQGDELTALEALDRFGSLRLGARIHDLTREGYPIRRRMVNVMNRNGDAVRVAAYRRGCE